MIHAGMMRHKITIQSQSDAATTYGTVRTWTNVVTGRPAEIMPNFVGREIRGVAEGNIEQVRFRMRYSTEIIAPDMRILHNGQYYRISSVDNVRGMNVELIITAETART